MQEIISRAEAKARGLKLYFTGIPCKNGHSSQRIVEKKYCLECDRLRKRLAYHRDIERERVRCANWRSKNQAEHQKSNEIYRHRVSDVIAVLRKEMPELLKEFGL